jgi:hypothetical protein
LVCLKGFYTRHATTKEKKAVRRNDLTQKSMGRRPLSHGISGTAKVQDSPARREQQNNPQNQHIERSLDLRKTLLTLHKRGENMKVSL